MPIRVPQIDSRSYQQWFNEALARIPVHNPEWTNFNQSDPGVTLLQLFAFLTESLIYRANRIPERNRAKFLQLLGIPLQPATASRGLVVYENTTRPCSAIRVDAEAELNAGRLVFRSLDAVDALPLEITAYYKAPLDQDRKAEVQDIYTKLYAADGESADDLLFYETLPFATTRVGSQPVVLDLARDTADGVLWLALLAPPRVDPDEVRTAIEHKILSIGVIPDLSPSEKVVPAGKPATGENEPGLLVEIPRLPDEGLLPERSEDRVARYQALGTTATGPLLTEAGILKVTLPAASELGLWSNLEPGEAGTGNFPPAIEDTEQERRIITWLRLRARPGRVQVQAEAPSNPPPYTARLSWVGGNVARIEQRARVAGELVGRGTGQPDQILRLINTPVLAGSVRLTVGSDEWTRIDDLFAATPEVPSEGSTAAIMPAKAQVFQIDPESGELRFGDGLHGARPAAGAIIQATYDYGGGSAGNLGAGAINKGSLPAGIKVSNPWNTWGGDEGETVAEAEKRIPAWLRHRDRLVSTDDIREITYRTPGVDIGRVEVLPLYHPRLGEARAEGVVTVLVIPSNDPAHPGAPEPDQPFLTAVCRHLEPRRLITTELHVAGPEYVGVWISIGIEVAPGHEFATVRDAVRDRMLEYLSPLVGGPAPEHVAHGTGWLLGQSIERLELWAVATRVTGVSKVLDVLLAAGDGNTTERIALLGLQLPRVDGVGVQTGEPQRIEELRGDAPAPEARKVKPIPVIPTEC